MRHAAHKAAKVSNERFNVAKALFTSSRGSHTAKAVRMVQLANGGGAVVGLEPAVAEKLNEVAPMSRRAMREAARVAGRRSAFMASASLAALVGTAATAMAVGQQNASEMTFADNATTTTQMKRVSDNAASRSESRSGLDALASTSNSGDWQLGETSSSMDTNLLSKSIADNPNVAVLMDQDAGLLPSGFNPNHGTGDTGNDYPYGQCTWWAYTRRAQLGLPAGSHFGNARSWGDSARALGYWVDNTARHVGDIVVFAPGQQGADGYYGHVAIVEEVNADGSIKISESNVKGLGVISDRTFTAQEASQMTYIHY